MLSFPTKPELPPKTDTHTHPYQTVSRKLQTYIHLGQGERNPKAGANLTAFRGLDQLEGTLREIWPCERVGENWIRGVQTPLGHPVEMLE